MVQIVTTILPHLSGNARAESELKSGFVILLGEAVAEVVWAALRDVRNDLPGGGGDGKNVLANVFELQKALDAAKTDKDHMAWSDLLQKIAKEITERVEGKVEAGSVQRALLRTLRRQPTRRVDIYDQFVALWLDREIRKVMGQRGSLSIAPQQLRLEVRGWLVEFANFVSPHGTRYC